MIMAHDHGTNMSHCRPGGGNLWRTLYGVPKVKNTVWTVGFKQNKEPMALQVEYPDREIANDSDLLRAELDLENRMRGAILMST
jgi:hypothetical protein